MGLSNGLNSTLKRMAYWRPAVLVTMVLMLFSLASSGSRSGGTISTRSTSPLISALTWVEVSGIQIHSTRSTLATLPPARPDAGSARGLYFGFLT